MAEHDAVTEQVDVGPNYAEMSQADYQAMRAGHAPAPVDEAVPDETPVETPVDEAPTDDVDETPAANTRVQKRINTLTRQREEARAAVERERQANLALQERLLILERGQQQPQDATPAPSGPPDPDDYETHEAYIVDLTTHAAHEAMGAAQQNAAYQAEMDRRQAAATAAKAQLDTSIEAARAAYDDFDEVISNAEVLPAPLVSKAIAYNEHAGHLGYHLLMHPDEMARINEITDPTRLLLELARIEAQVVPSPDDETTQPPAPPPRRTAAPAPVAPLVGDRGGGGVPKDPTSSQEAWQAYRKAGGGR